MAEAKNNFLKSKMNKDLDDRLVPVGEYRNAQNISIAKSEGNDVGALENILGNNLVSNFPLPTDTYGVEIIGYFMDVVNDRIVVFMTNYVDTSSDGLSNFSPTNAYHAIGIYNINSATSHIIVSGRFLNFSKTNEIYNVDIIENLLFWTDNRNQPRKINLLNWANPNYYTTEDTISVSKYYPYKTIDLIQTGVTGWNVTPVGSGYALANNVPCSGGSGTGLTVNITNVGALGEVNSITINNPGIGYVTGDVVNIAAPLGTGGGAQVVLVVQTTSMMRDVVSDYLPDGTTPNPYRQPYYNGTTFDPITWKGDSEYLKEKFVRFSYRFKFDDDEYSLIAPFTQTCFIPKQDGYFVDKDDLTTFKSTEVGFMENKVNDINLIITSPSSGNWNNIGNDMKIKEVDILVKESGENVVKIVDTIKSNLLAVETSTFLQYNYKSSKPWKVLPTNDILRVADQVPVRAFAQEVIGNRIVYGNYIDKPTPPLSLNYSCDIVEKTLNTQIEYQNQNLKQNRTYQVGVVLSDRYGRQSSVILSTLDDSQVSSQIKGSTIFNKFKTSDFSNGSSGSLFTPGHLPSTAGDVWDGDSLNIDFWETISSVRNNDTGEPGIYNATTNPLGWYTYKIVVKQTQQDYYNVYFPGILSGYIDGESRFPTISTASEPVAHFVLHGDNINKIPRDLTLVGPNQTTFRSGRPSPQDDPSYYKFVDSSGNAFVADPYDADDERLLKERDRERDLDSGSQITNASIKLSPRVVNFVSMTANMPPAGLGSGSGYSIGNNIPTTTVGSNPANGNGMTVNILTIGDGTTVPIGGILSVEVNNPGTGYQSGDFVRLAGGGGTGAFFQIQILYTNNTKQSYPGSSVDTVVTIGTGKELGLWDSAATSPYDTAPVFYGYETNPYIAKTDISDYSNKNKDSQGVTGPSPAAGKYNVFMHPTGVTPAPGNGDNYVAGSKNISTKPVSTISPNRGITGILFNIDAINDSGLVSDIGANGPLIDGGLSIANPDGKGIKGIKATESNFKLYVLAGDDPGTATGGQAGVNITREEWPGYMSPVLTISETEPLESKLDIFWETSTSGVITDLNSLILTGDVTTPVDLVSAVSVPVTYSQNESMGLNVDLTGPIYGANQNGNIISGPITATLVNVRDGYNAQRSSDFNIVNNAGGNYFNIETNNYFMSDYDNNIRGNFTFEIDLQVPSSNYGTTGTFINRTFFLGPYQLENRDPQFISPPNYSFSVPWTGGLIHTYTAENGSFTGSLNSPLNTDSITWELKEATTNPMSGIFYLTQLITGGQVELSNIRKKGSAGIYTVTLTAYDGAGFSASWTNQIEITS